MRESRIAPAAGLKILRASAVAHGRGIDDDVAIGSSEFFAKHRREFRETGLFLRTGSLHLALERGVDQLEIENSNAHRFRSGGGR